MAASDQRIGISDEKIYVGAVLSLVTFSTDMAISATGVACASPGNCSYTTVVTVGVISGGASVPVPRQIAQPFAQCLKEKGEIDKQYELCKYSSALDNGREVSRCSSLGNSGWSWGGSAGYQVIFFNATYSIENPTYDKCINQVAAGLTSALAYCGVKYVDDKNIARTAMGGRCSGFYQ